MMVTRRNAVSEIIGFMSIENGLILAATAARGMPLVVEISVAFSVLVAFIVIGVFLFRIRERFDSVELEALDEFRGERRWTNFLPNFLSSRLQRASFFPRRARRGAGVRSPNCAGAAPTNLPPSSLTH